MSTALTDGILGALLGVLVAVIGVFLTYRSMRVAAQDGATQVTLELDRLFIEHPELRTYLYDHDACLPTDKKERHKAEAVLEFVADTLEAVLDKIAEQRLFNLYTSDDRDSWERYVDDTLRRSPRLRDFLAGKPGWYPSIEGRGIQPAPPEADPVPADVGQPAA